jgi:wobble nucleotide-excising tRNase
MTEAERQTLKKFDAKVRNLLASYVALQRENIDLYEELDKKEEEIRSLQEQAQQYKKDYNNLKLAKMIEISDTDFKDAKQRITNLVREVNNCINLLNAQ